MRIFFFVFIAHFFLAIYLYRTGSIPLSFSKKNKIVVHTIQLQPQEIATAPKPTPVKKKELSKNQKNKIANIRKQLEEGTKNSVATGPELKIQKIENSSLKPSRLEHEIISQLREFLKLPEYGDVELNIIISSSGKITDVVVLSSESTTNQNYLEKSLKKLQLRTLNDKPITFHLIMSAE